MLFKMLIISIQPFEQKTANESERATNSIKLIDGFQIGLQKAIEEIQQMTNITI